MAPEGIRTVRVKVFRPTGEMEYSMQVMVQPGERNFYAGLMEPLKPNNIVQVATVHNGKEVHPGFPILAPPPPPPPTPAPAPGPVKRRGVERSEVQPEPQPAPVPVVPKPNPTPVADVTTSSAEAKAKEPVPVCSEDSEGDTWSAPEIDRLREGAKVVSGKSPVRQGRVHVCVGGVAAKLTGPGAVKTGSVGFTDGSWQAELVTPLMANERVLVVVESDDGEVRLVNNKRVEGDPCATGTFTNDVTIGVLRDGDVTVGGSSALNGAKVSVCVNGKVQELEGDGKAGADGVFALNLRRAVKLGEQVRVIVAAADGSKTIANSLSVVDACDKSKITFTQEPREGEDTLFVAGAKSLPNSKCVVSAFINGDQARVIVQGNETNAVATDAEGYAMLKLRQPIDAGQCVTVTQYGEGRRPSFTHDASGLCSPDPRKTVQNSFVEEPKDARSVTEPSLPSASRLATSRLDLGRIRSYFAAGVVLSQGVANFTQQNVFLAFNLDKNWLWGGPVAHGGETSQNRTDYKRMMFNTFFEARLTAIPAVATGTTTQSNAQSGQTGQNGGSTPLTTVPISEYLSTRKAATLQAGAYAPIVIATWTYDRAPHSISLGPLAKIGLLTPLDDPNQKFDQRALDFSFLAGSRAFYVSHSYGARLGFHKHSYSRDVGPELVSYFDVSIGRFNNFDSDPQLRTVRCDSQFYTTGPCYRDPRFDGDYPLDPGTGQFQRYSRPWRFSFEGLMKVPTTPLVLGFSANVRQNFGRGNSRTVGNTRDDLRFFIGTKFDAAKLVRAIRQVN